MVLLRGSLDTDRRREAEMSSADGAAARRRVLAALAGDTAQREAAYTELTEIAHGASDEDIVSAATECVGPLIETVLAAPASVVDAAEFRRAHDVLGELAFGGRGAAQLRVCAEYFRDGRDTIAWAAPANAYAAVFAKDASALTAEDALTVACTHTLVGVGHAVGMDASLELGGTNGLEWAGRLDSNRTFGSAADPASEAFVERLCLLWLEVLRAEDPLGGGGDLSEVMRIGVRFSHVWTMSSGRAKLAMKMIEAGILREAMSLLQQSSPAEWVSWQTASGVEAGMVFNLGWSLSTIVLPVNKTELLLESGFIDATISILKAYEQRGPNLISDANISALTVSITALNSLDLGAAEARPVIELLSAIPSALGFMLAHPLSHVRNYINRTSQVA
eukprot:COSAG06_NODE_2156_length_7453_cov_4.416372_1_plen_392_part_00